MTTKYIRIILLTIVLLVCFGVRGMSAQADHPLTLVWQTAFDADSALIEPDYITVDSKGNIYIGELSYGTVKEYDSDGKYVMPFRLDSMDVTGVAVDSQGNLLVGAFDQNRIQKFDSTGKFIANVVMESSWKPTTIAVDGQDNIYVVAGAVEPHPHIWKYDKHGTFITKFGTQIGHGDGDFGDGTAGTALATDKDGNVYATDQGANRIQKFDSSGKFVAKFPLPDDGKPADNGLVMSGDPYGVAVDGQGNIYVAGSHFLRKLAPDGKILAQWPTEGDLTRAGRVAVSAQGDIYITAESEVKSTVKGFEGKLLKALLLKKFKQS